MPIGLRFPFEETNNGGVFGSTVTTKEKIKSNLTYFFTTKRGQRPMRSDLFSPLYDYIGEPMDEILATEMKHAVEEKMADFFSDVQLREVDIQLNTDENIVAVTIIYSIPALGDAVDSLEINLDSVTT